jgi:hypothetical protein
MHLCSYLEHRFGGKVEGVDYHKSCIGERITNYDVEILILHKLYDRLARLILKNNSLGMSTR